MPPVSSAVDLIESEIGNHSQCPSQVPLLGGWLVKSANGIVLELECEMVKKKVCLIYTCLRYRYIFKNA